MAEVGTLSESDKAFLAPYLPSPRGLQRTTSTDDPLHGHDEPRALEGEESLPFVTLTYAQSLDSAISLHQGVRTTLSGIHTKSMTHYLRMHHDAILVGVGTAISDDPGLNNRYPGASFVTQPRPIIVDPNLRWNSESSRVVRLAKDSVGKKPWVIHSRQDARGAITETSCEYIYVQSSEANTPDFSSTAPVSPSRTLSWRTILITLKRRGIESIMIEGGATVISSLLGQAELVDAVVITIAPTWLGENSVNVAPTARIEGGAKVNAARLNNTSWRQFGADAVVCGRLQA